MDVRYFPHDHHYITSGYYCLDELDMGNPVVRTSHDTVKKWTGVGKPFGLSLHRVASQFNIQWAEPTRPGERISILRYGRITLPKSEFAPNYKVDDKLTLYYGGDIFLHLSWDSQTVHGRIIDEQGDRFIIDFDVRGL